MAQSATSLLSRRKAVHIKRIDRLSRRKSAVFDANVFRLTHGSKPRSKPKYRILIAEDEPRVRERTALRLAKRGMIVRKVGDLSKLDVALDAFKPDLLILDEHFDNGISGYAGAIEATMGRHPLTKVMVTMDGQEADLLPGRRPAAWGAAGVLEKATMFRRSELEDRVEKALRRT